MYIYKYIHISIYIYINIYINIYIWKSIPYNFRRNGGLSNVNAHIIGQANSILTKTGLGDKNQGHDLHCDTVLLCKTDIMGQVLRPPVLGENFETRIQTQLVLS